MKDPTRLLAKVSSPLFNTDKFTYCALIVEVSFEDGSESVFRSKFVLPLKKAYDAVNQIMFNSLSNVNGLLDTYDFIRNYGLFDLTSKK